MLTVGFPLPQPFAIFIGFEIPEEISQVYRKLTWEGI